MTIMLSAVLLMALAAWLQGSGLPPIEYTVSLSEPQTQMVDIRMVIRNVKTATVDVALPVWRPGRYEILDPAGSIRDVRASMNAGNALSIIKTDKTTWQITTNGAEEIRVGGDDGPVHVEFDDGLRLVQRGLFRGGVAAEH